LAKEVAHWLLTTPREKPVKIGAKVVSHGIVIVGTRHKKSEK
jgi:hypothetical protein